MVFVFWLKKNRTLGYPHKVNQCSAIPTISSRLNTLYHSLLEIATIKLNRRLYYEQHGTDQPVHIQDEPAQEPQPVSDELRRAGRVLPKLAAGLF